MQRHRDGRALVAIFVRLLDRLRAQLWFIPGLAASGAFVLARTLVHLDRGVIARHDTWFLFQGTPAAARELVSTIASATMTFTGLVFSITVLVLQLASAQFSPRVLRTFLEDRHTHVAMAVFVGTFVFAMSLLLSIRGSTEHVELFVPALSVFVAFLLVLASVGVFIHYIHHIAHSVRAVTIIRRVADETRRAIDEMFPNTGVDAPPVEVPRRARERPATVMFRGRAGHLAYVAEQSLLELAEAHDALIEVLPRVGDFVLSEAPVIRHWPADRRELARAVEALVIEPERTGHQDPGFGFRQLVDIAARALSPGINDPSTAVQVLDELHELLRHLAGRAFPSPVRANAAGTPRLILPRPPWDDFVHLALEEVRQYGAGSSQVMNRLRALLDDCLAFVPPDRAPPLAEQRGLLQAAVTPRRDGSTSARR
jgi:uncharacterized membrane protein